MRLELPSFEMAAERILPIKSKFGNRSLTIKEWVAEHRTKIRDMSHWISVDNPEVNLNILKMFLVDLLMKSMNGERGTKLKENIDVYIHDFKDLNKATFAKIIVQSSYRWGNSGVDTMLGIVNCYNKDLKRKWESYFNLAEKNYYNNFPEDPFLKIKNIGFKVRDLTLSNFNDKYIANDLQIVRVSTRLGLLNLGFPLLKDKSLEMGNNPSNPKNYLFLHKLFIDISRSTNNKYSPVDMDRIFWHFGRTICSDNPECKKCPINNICLTGRYRIA